MRAAILLASALIFDAHAQLVQWNLVSPYPTGEHLNAVTYGAGRFVAVGDSDILYSEDGGVTWNEGTGFAPESYKSVAYGNGKFVTASSNASVLTSTDGKKWIRHGVNAALNSVTSIAFGNGVFVMTAGNAQVGHSVNGEDWRFSTEGTLNANAGSGGWVAFGNGRFVIVEYIATTAQGLMSFITSTDGVNWTRYVPLLPEASPGCTRACPYWQRADGVTFAQGRFVITALTSGLTSKILYSTDGVTYQTGSILAPGYFPSLFSMNDNVVVIAGQIPSWSANLSDWNPLTGAEGARAGADGGGNYVLVGSAGFAMHGSSMQTLQRVDSAEKSALLNGVAAAGATIVGVQGASAPVLIVSTNNGKTFTSVIPPDTSGLLYNVAQAHGMFVAVGAGGTIIRSTEGVTWSKRLSNTSSDLHDITFGGGLWVAVGSNGKIVTSSDTSIFSLRASGTEVVLNGVTYDGANFVVVGESGIILISPNGIDWSLTGTDEAKDLYAVAFGNGRFVASGVGGIVHTWAPGGARETTTLAGTSTLRVVYDKGRFLALDSGTTQAFVSTDGLNWTANPLPYGANIGINVSDNRLWVSGAAIPFLSGSLIWNGTEKPIAVAGVVASGHFSLSIDVPQPGNYRVYRAATADAVVWDPRELLNVASHADWTDPDPLQSAGFYILKRE